MSEISKHHGSPYDRGSADAYYGRGCNPHYYVGASYTSVRLEQVDMSEKEVLEYMAGYEECVDAKEY